MGGSHSKSEQPKEKSKVKDSDIEILKLKMHRDRLMERRNEAQRQVDKAGQMAKQLATEGRKEQAMYYLGKRRILDKSLKDISSKFDLVEQRVKKVEQVMDDIELTEVIASSNSLIKELMNKVNVDVIEKAGDLGMEIDMKNEEIQRAISQYTNDDELLQQYDNLGESNIVSNTPTVINKQSVQVTKVNEVSKKVLIDDQF